MIIDDKIEALTTFKNGLNDVMTSTLLANKEVIIDMNATIQLFEQGIDSRGVEIASFRPYTARTVSIKRQKGQPIGRVTLRDSGDFHNSIDINFFEDGFTIIATDIKTVDLVKKYGEHILGLTDEHINELVNDYIYPTVIEYRNSLL